MCPAARISSVPAVMVPLSDVRVVVAAPVAATRLALRRLVTDDWGWTLVDEAGDGFAAVRAARVGRADLLLADAELAGITLRELFRLLPPSSGVAVIGLVDHPQQHATPGGATVLKDVPAAHLRGVVEPAVSAARAAWNGAS